MAKTYKWKVQGYGRGVRDMENHMNKMSAEGWEVFKIQEIFDKTELSAYPNEYGGLSDGDSFHFDSTTFIYYRK